jgi:hypothetical protein
LPFENSPKLKASLKSPTSWDEGSRVSWFMPDQPVFCGRRQVGELFWVPSYAYVFSVETCLFLLDGGGEELFGL